MFMSFLGRSPIKARHTGLKTNYIDPRPEYILLKYFYLIMSLLHHNKCYSAVQTLVFAFFAFLCIFLKNLIFLKKFQIFLLEFFFRNFLEFFFRFFSLNIFQIFSRIFGEIFKSLARKMAELLDQVQKRTLYYLFI